MVGVETLFSSQLLQLVLVGVIVLIAVLIGQTIYQVLSRVHANIVRQVRGQKRPPLTYVLFDIVWAPLILFAVIAIVRAALYLLPQTRVLQGAAVLLNGGLLVTFLWFAVRVFQEVLAVSEEADGEEKQTA